MKRLLFLLLFPALLMAQTRNIVPRAAGQGGIGTSAKPWATSYFDTVNVLGPLFGSGPINIGSYTITSGLINGQTISSAANFTGTVSVASTLTVGGSVDVIRLDYLGILDNPSTWFTQNAYYDGVWHRIVDGAPASGIQFENATGSIDFEMDATTTGTPNLIRVAQLTSSGNFSLSGDLTVNGTGVSSFAGSVSVGGSFSTIVASPTANYIASSTDQAMFISASVAAYTVFLPTAWGFSGIIYTFKKTDSSVNAVTVKGSGSELIDASNVYALANQYKYVVLQSNGAQWFIIGNN